jgi:hypothetical protein
MPKVRHAVGAAFRAEAKFLQGVLKDGIKSQAPGGAAYKPLAATTIAVRKFLGIKSTKALIRTGDSLKAIKVTPEGRAGSVKYSVFVGILTNEKSPSGRPIYKDMIRSEYGGPTVVIQITPKMRAFLHLALGGVKALRKLGPPQPSQGFLVVKVPPRPTFEPIWKFWGATSAARILNTARALYRGPFIP